MKWLLNLLLLGVLSGCASSPAADSPLAAPAGRIIDLRSGQALSAEQLLSQAAGAERLIVGEKHDNRQHHLIEQWLVEQLPQIRPQGSVLLEMLTPSQQAQVDKVKAWLQTGPSARPSRVAELVAWQPGWPWPQYGDLAMTLLRAPYPLWAANLDRDEMREAYRLRPALQGVESARPEVASRLIDLIRQEHGGELRDDVLRSMLAVQQQRDRRMAQRLLAAPAPALLIAGAYHAMADMGVPLHVRDLAPQARPLVLILAEDGARIDSRHADLVWYTAAARP
ncbi:iron-regulated protein [Xenophilus sp. AP218F]|nr:iron-regulated protein [Xenophilus sp. AP218F]